MEVRVATPDDGAKIASVQVRSWQVAYKGIVPDDYLAALDIGEREDRWRRILEELNQPSRIVVAKDRGEIVGFSGFGPTRGEETSSEWVGEVFSIYVLPECWRKGAGAALLDVASGSLAAAGFTEATLWVIDSNIPARRFYEREGWWADGATRSDDERGFVLSEVRYRKALRSGRLFAPLEPYDSGYLDVGDGQRIYWESCGNPSGMPAVVLHGGPGSGCTPQHRRLFDPLRYRVVLIDQRGAGRSQPRVHATTDLSTNTTGHLVGDLDRIRVHLDVDRWVVFGHSWGTTLALAYAEQHPERVIAMVLASVTTTRPAEIHWLYHDLGRLLPEEWERFCLGVQEVEREGDLVDAYYRLLHEQPDVTLRERAAQTWCAWEDAVSPLPDCRANPRYEDPEFRMTFARIVTHYFHHRAWLGPAQLLSNADRLTDVPGVLIHGRMDIASPMDTAWRLARTWPGAELRVVDTGHSGGEAMTGAVIEATNRFAGSDTARQE
jgi:proline iminopeptidase